MLKRAMSMVSKTASSKERFEIPKVKGHIEGNKTIIANFIPICDALSRDPEHLLKFLQRELATPAYIDGHRLVLGRKLSSSLINQKIEEYVNTYVLCKECHKPDTQLIKEGGILVLKCMACGAKRPIKSKI